jgi:tRNA(Ile)-lysidine synthase
MGFDPLAAVSTFIAQHELLPPPARPLVAVSGGIDSVVLAHLLRQAGYPLGLAHANFGLRGPESDGDEAFVQQLAAHWQVPFFTQRFDTQGYAQAHQLSVQVAARQLRYAWFAQLLAQHGYSHLATAHHQTDSAETMLYNLAKGTGLAGLHGIRPRQGPVVRPLLALTRAQVEAYAQAHELPWREDSSNATDQYARNQIRHHVLPPLRQINPRLETALAQTANKLAAVERVFAREVARLAQACHTQRGPVHYYQTAPVLAEPERLILLATLLRPFGFSYQQSQQVVQSLHQPPGGQWLSGSHWLVHDRSQLVLCPRQPPQASLALTNADVYAETADFSLKINTLNNQPDYSFPAPEAGCALAAEALAWPLVLRPWQPGDWLQPLGLRGRKKVSDLLIERKVPLNLKSRVWVLVSGGQVAWVLGHRTSERFKVQPATQTVVEFSLDLPPAKPNNAQL